jgi:hypothetical protein
MKGDYFTFSRSNYGVSSEHIIVYTASKLLITSLSPDPMGKVNPGGLYSF